MHHPGIVSVLLMLSLLNTMFIWWTAKRYKRAVASATWPSTPGIVEAMENYAYEGDDGSITYSYLCRFTYSVNGKLYKSYTTKLAGTRQLVNSAQLDHLINSYKPGTQLQVYYDPVSPEDNVLMPGDSKPLLIQFVFLILILIALLSATVAFSNNSRPIEIHDASDVLTFSYICKHKPTA